MVGLVERFLIDRATLTRRGLSERSRDGYRDDLSGWARSLCRLDGRFPDVSGPTDPAPLSLVGLTISLMIASGRRTESCELS